MYNTVVILLWRYQIYCPDTFIHLRCSYIDMLSRSNTLFLFNMSFSSNMLFLSNILVLSNMLYLSNMFFLSNILFLSNDILIQYFVLIHSPNTLFLFLSRYVSYQDTLMDNISSFRLHTTRTDVFLVEFI